MRYALGAFALIGLTGCGLTLSPETIERRDRALAYVESVAVQMQRNGLEYVDLDADTRAELDKYCLVAAIIAGPLDPQLSETAQGLCRVVRVIDNDVPEDAS